MAAPTMNAEPEPQEHFRRVLRLVAQEYQPHGAATGEPLEPQPERRLIPLAQFEEVAELFARRARGHRTSAPSDAPEDGAAVLPFRIPGRCSETTDHNVPCDAGIEWGLCSTHKDQLDQKLHRLETLERLSGRCRAQDATGTSCANDAKTWGLCEEHHIAQERELLAGFVSQRRRRRSSPKQQRPAFLTRPAPTAYEEARARVEDILSRRRREIDPDEAYTIPSEELRPIGSLWMEGLSLIEGDVPIEFPFFEETEDGVVGAYSKRGSKAFKDMPLASRYLFGELQRCLKLFPGYTRRCKKTGRTITQPLPTLAYKLLRGFTTPDEVRFFQFSSEGKEQIQRRELEEQPTSRKRLPIAPIEILRMLLRVGVGEDDVARELRALLKLRDVSNKQIRTMLKGQTPSSQKQAHVAPIEVARMLLRIGADTAVATRELRVLWKPDLLSDQEMGDVIKAVSS